MADEPIYMDEWLRNHGRSIPMSNNGTVLHWDRTPQAFDDDEVQKLTDKGIHLRTFTPAEIEAMDNVGPPNWPWSK